jgi:hypothetical protein
MKRRLLASSNFPFIFSCVDMSTKKKKIVCIPNPVRNPSSSNYPIRNRIFYPDKVLISLIKVGVKVLIMKILVELRFLIIVGFLAHIRFHTWNINIINYIN